MEKYKLKNIKLVIFDLDGTIYFGPNIIDGAVEAVEFFRKQNVRVCFGTNNSSKSRLQISEKLNGMGIDAHKDEVVTSSYLAIQLAKELGLDDLYIFGSKSIIPEFEEEGIKVNQTESAKNLLIGYDINMDYAALTTAFRVALHADKIMACNMEKAYPGKDMEMFPSCGAMVKPIEWCANREVDYVVGKPSRLMVDLIAKKYGISNDEVLVIGDTYDVDILLAKNAGAKSIYISNEKRDGLITIKSVKDIESVIEI